MVIFSCGEKLPSGGDKPGTGTTNPENPENPGTPDTPVTPPVEGALTGKGIESDPYIITKVEHIKEVQDLITAGSSTYICLGADLDMASVADYVPFNCASPFDRKIYFDGKGHTISNFSCSDAKCANPSFFGVLNGSCRNLKMVDPVISARDQRSGVIAASVGREGLPATVENVTVTNAVVNTACERAGLVCGDATEASFDNVSVQGTLTSTFTSKEAKAGGFVGQVSASSFKDCSSDVVLKAKRQDVGGFAGKVLGKVTFTGCKVKVVATSSAPNKNRVGGLIGWNSSEKTVITDCHVLSGSSLIDESGRTTSDNGCYGGLIGFGDTDGTVLEITGCSADVQIDGGVSAFNSCFIGCLGYASTTTIKDSHASGKVFSKTGNYTAGLIGSVGKDSEASITNSYFSGDVEATGGYVGGIVGGTQGKLTLSKVFSEGTVSAMNAYVGGLIGAAMNDGNTVTNCFSTARIHARGQQCGGLVGTTTNKLTMSCCYASGDVYSGTSGAAGLVGRVQKSSSITKCIAWNKNVASSRSANNVYACGAILGCAQEKGTYAQCIRRYDMVFTDDFITLEDQEDFVDAMPPLPSYSTASHQQFYHGKAAAPDATLASVAKSLGWDESVWDFSSSSAMGITIKQLGDNKVEF
jgi:hypothetical protein